MSDKELVEFLKDISPTELLIVNSKGKLEVLVCPFKVILKEDVAFLKKYQIVYVTFIKVTRDIKMVFIIEEKPFFADHFSIL